MFNKRRTNIHDEQRIGRPSIATENHGIRVLGPKTDNFDWFILPQGETITGSAILWDPKKVKESNSKQTKGMCLLHDNACPNTANATKVRLDSFGWGILNHPAYFPDLVSSDFHLFTILNTYMGGKNFKPMRRWNMRYWSGRRWRESSMRASKSLWHDLQYA